MELESHCSKDDIVIIHDAVRPLISQEIITDCIAKAKEYGSGLSAVGCQETIMRTEDGESGSDGIDRNDIMRVQTPQAYQYGKALWAHKRHFEQRHYKCGVYKYPDAGIRSRIALFFRVK